MRVNFRPLITADELHAGIKCRSELAIIDVREAKFYAQGHINLSAHLPLSSFETQVLKSIPRKSVPLVVVDDYGADQGEAARAMKALGALSFTNVRMVEGGISAWKKTYPLGTGYNTLVKTFSDLAHTHYSTPTITPAQLQARLSSGRATTVIDCRPEPEYVKMTISGARNAPGVELALCDLTEVSCPDHLYVVSCFSRTRGIVATTTLVQLNNLQNVAFLEDGVMAAFLHGLPTGPGDIRLAPPGQIAPGVVLRQQAENIVKRHGLSVIDYTQYVKFLDEQDIRTLYIFDVRPESSYLEAHLPDAVSAPGGQLLMTYDAHAPVRNARIVLVDDAHMKRAAVSAFWLSHFNNAEIYILPVSKTESSLISEAATIEPPHDVRWLEPHECQARLDNGLQVIDVGSSLNYEQGHIPSAHFALRSLLPLWLETHSLKGAVLFTSPDGVNAAYAASEMSRTFGIDAYALRGGTEAWRSAGLPIEVDFHPVQLISPFHDDWGSTMRAKVNREQIFRDYLAWERGLGHDIPKDETVQFYWPVAAAK